MARRFLWASLALAPVVIHLRYVAHSGDVVLFALSAAALVPLAWVIGESTEHAAEHTGPGVGGFLNASFGNAPELIIAIFAVDDGLPNVVRGSIAGSIVSNAIDPGWLLPRDLEQMGLAERLDFAVFSSEVGFRKPHPAIFERALDALDVVPERTLFVGDRLYEDVRGAGELGMTTVQALWFRADENPDGREPDHQAFTQLDVLNIARRLAP